ncbi:uncharacterized protein LOC581768 isoform X2 [Strongylocentrotus purpuratus]|uniref:Peptidase C54 catalytic domain-containing protein n=1 Tax=Strongylocentrotus purpuratus TaxID=7668 RepID=A0A7M7REI7_STRPU|nr:uncharacterized protein LOC581768 isoform X2 [Strongylocentrotus purpuratus]
MNVFRVNIYVVSRDFEKKIITLHAQMDFLNKPVSEVWKATKRTLAEIMDSNEGVRSPGTSTQRSTYDQELKRDSEPSGSSSQSPSTSRKSRSSFAHVKGRHRSSESNLNMDNQVTERENRPMDCNEGMRTEIGSGQRNASNDSLDFAEVQTSPPQPVMPKIKGKDKQSSDRERTKTAWTKFRLGYLGKTSNSTEVDDSERGGADKSPILPSLMDKSSPAYISTNSSGVGSPGKTKSASRASRRSRGEINLKGFDFRSRFRSNSSDRATMRRREREERERTRRSSYTRSTSFDANDEVEDETNTASDEAGDEDQSEKVKSKLLSMWNNVKYGWTVKTKTNFSIHKPIWFLGKCYHQRPEDPDPERPPGMDSVRSMVIEMFKQDFSSRLWMTYRREFPTLAGSNFTSDCGWGCMLRSGQMMLAHSLILHFLGREWNIYKPQTQEMLQFHRQIVRWFGDQPLDMSPFSVHRLVGIGQNNGKKVGDWYGPSSVAHILKEAMDSAHELNPLLGEVCIYVAQDCTVYKQDVIDLCRSKSKKRLQPVYRDIPSSEDNSPVKCTTNPNKGPAYLPGVQHEHLQRSSPIVTKDQRQSTSSLDSGTRVGSRLAQSHERILSMYSGSGRSEASSRSSTNGSQNNVTSTSGLKDGPSPHDSNMHRPGSRDGSSGQQYSTSLPVRTDVGLYSESPDTSREERFNMEDGLALDSCTGGDLNERDNERTKDSAQGSVDMKDVSEMSNIEDEDEDVFGSSEEEVRTRNPSYLYTNSPLSHQSTSESSSRSEASPDDLVTNSSSHPHPHHSPAVLDSENNIGGSPGDVFTTDAGEPPIDPSRSRTSTSTEGGKPWCAVVIMIPVRLGGDEVNPVYIRPIQSLFTLESCLGIIGGKPKHSLFFVGFQEEKLIHLDPHYCQQVVDMKTRDFPLWSFHCMSPRKMSISKMDPSCTIGFYIRTEEQFEQLCKELPTVVSPLGSHSSDYPMFIVRDGRCGDWQNKNTNTNRPERYLRVRHVDENGRLIAPVKESEDFVLLDS